MPYTSIEIRTIAVTMKKEERGIREISRLLGKSAATIMRIIKGWMIMKKAKYIYQIQARKTPKNDEERRTDAGKNASRQPEDDVPCLARIGPKLFSAMKRNLNYIREEESL